MESLHNFKRGDIVEVLCDDHFELGIVLFPPESDDCYTVLFGSDYNFESYPKSIYVFPPRMPVSDELKTVLTTYLNDYWLWEIEAFAATTLPKCISRLPVFVRVDDCGIWDNRIKFQTDKSDKIDIQKMISMSIEDEPKIVGENLQHDLSDDELQQIKAFVKNNKQVLLDMNKQKISAVEYFFIDIKNEFTN
ncbi:MAG: hypothetical protein EZS26_001955 [Candidatus Ordinivivax streblomastigis]|uniref:Uncharacterized protein n=1 Tax=Candidatus Ordinivivax streblomastigis TaxID=2540710 RepID=A0A5M8P0P4_9BACT|nr:MAG: hypothetical protein EZS26_001955 [Candidatus Ordinivivax streblomastigis]